MRTLGIDLATRNGKTGICTVDWSTRTASIEVGKRTEAAIVDTVRSVGGNGWTAIDAPFGFPDAFSKIVARWARGGSVTIPDDDRPVIRRLTDIHVHERQEAAKVARLVKGGSWSTWPLSSVVERITPTAVRCAAILSELGYDDCRDGVGCRVVETYPIAVMRLWGIETRSYKSNNRHCSVLIDTLTQAAQLDLAGKRASWNNDDAVDALVCALIARVAKDGRSGPEQEDFTAIERATIRREGWIHLPPRGHDVVDLAGLT